MSRLLGLLLLACLAITAQAEKFIGTWACTATTPDGAEVPWTLELSKPGGQLKVAIKSERGDMAVPEPRFDGDTLSFSVTVGEGTFQIRLEFKGDKVEGIWKGGEESGAMKGSRK